jgi:quercetin dioxygenase-like cupin family protein
LPESSNLFRCADIVFRTPPKEFFIAGKFLFGTITPADMNFKLLENIHRKEILPGFWGRFIHTDSMTLAFWEIEKGSSLPEHSHFHEQVANIIEGKFEMTIEGVTHILVPGAVAIIPSNAIHSGKALSDCKILDIFSPVREDYKF